MFRINYKLRKPTEITPWGELHPSLSWFGLTDGLLWIEIGDSVIYEYTETYADKGDESVRYNDYQLARFLEDFSDILPHVAESIPRSLYDAIGTFETDKVVWEDLHAREDDDETFDKFYFGELETLTSWFNERYLDSGHLIGGPLIGCYRCGDNVKIRWGGVYPWLDLHDIWKYPSGCVEISYSEFVSEVERFFASFCKEMDQQVEEVVSNGIPGVDVDKDRLVQENKQRKETFDAKVRSLRMNKENLTDWKEILDIYDRMRSEVVNCDYDLQAIRDREY